MKTLASATLALVLALVFVAPALTQEDSFDTALYDRLNQHTNQQAAITSENVGQLQQAWKIDTEEEVSHAPLVQDGRVYFADWGGNVYAADANTGEVVWETKAQDKVMEMWPWYGFAGTGALGNGMLFEASVEGNAFALNQETGEVLWQVKIADQPQAGSISKLLYHDGLLYIGISSVEELLDKQKEGFEPNFQGKVLALDAETGERVWERQLVESPQTGAAVWSSFALDPDMNALFFTTSNNYTQPASETSDAMIAVGAKTGEILWVAQTTENDVWTTENQLGPDYAYGAGAQLFDAGGRQLVGAGQKSGFFHVFDRKTGERVWSTFVGYGATGGGIHAESAIGEDAVYVWSNNAYVYGMPPEKFPLSIAKLDLATGDYIWVKDKVQPAAIPAAGFLANDVYFVGSLDGTIKAYGAADGETLWSGKAPAAVASPLNVIGDTLFMGVGVPKMFGGTAKTNGMMAFSLGGQEGTPAAGTPTLPEASPSPAAEGAGTPVTGAAVDAAVTIETVSFAFQPDRFTIPADTETVIAVTNPSDVEHTFTVDELGINVEVHPGETKTATVNAPAGEHSFYCEYHPDRMTGTMTVQ